MIQEEGEGYRDPRYAPVYKALDKAEISLQRAILIMREYREQKNGNA